MRISNLFPAAAAALLMLAWTAVAEAATSTVVVVNGSPAMNVKIGNRTKLDLARTAIGLVVKSPPAGMAVGLAAFGHRNKTSCSDVEVMTPPETGTGNRINEALRGLKPTGKASVVAAVQAAAQALDYETKPANVVVITASLEACATADPCATATEMEGDGNDLTVTVIAIGIAKDQKSRTLACLAENTGGNFVPVANGDELITALDKAVKFEADQPLPKATVKGPAKVEQGTTFKVEWTGPKAKGDQIQISWPGQKPGDLIRSFLAGADGKPGTLTAPAGRGTYEIRYYMPSRDKVLARQILQVVETEARLEAPDKVAQGAVFTVTWKGGATRDDRVEIVRGGRPVASAKVRLDNGEATLDAPAEPGSYEIGFRAAGEPAAGFRRPLTVTAFDVKLDVPAQVNGGAEFAVNWAGPAAPLDEIEIAAPAMPDNRRIQGARIGATGQPVSLDAPAEGGDFVIRYRSGKSGVVLKKVPVKVAKAVASLEAPAEAEGGSSVEVSWKGPAARNDEIGIAAANAPPGRDSGFAIVPADGKPVRIDLPVAEGDYELRYWSARSRQVLAARKIRVRKPAVTLTFAGTVKAGATFPVEWKGPGGRYDDIRISLPTAEPEDTVRSAMLAAPGKPVMMLAPAKPGTYMVRYWSATGKAVLAAVALRVE